MVELRQKRLKILVLTPIYPRIAYGASYSSQVLLESDFAKVYEIHHINTRFADTAEDVGVFSIRKVVLFVKYLMQLLFMLITVKPDYVVLNPAFNRLAYVKDSVYHVICAMLMRRKVIWWAHNWGLQRLYDGSGFFMRRYIRWVADSVCAVVIIGNRQIADFDFLFQSDKLHVIPHGISPETYEMDRFDEHHDIHVLYLSNFLLTKGWRVVLEAAQQVCACRTDVTFDFYGNTSRDTSLSDIINAFDSTGFPERILYHGPAYGPVKHKAFDVADIFCFPTFYPMETFGIVNIEAMNAGLPVITTDHACISEIVMDGQGGILVTKQDVAALAQAILQLVEDEKSRHRMGMYNQKRFYGLFTVDKFTERWIDFIYGLKGRKSR